MIKWQMMGTIFKSFQFSGNSFFFLQIISFLSILLYTNWISVTSRLLWFIRVLSKNWLYFNNNITSSLNVVPDLTTWRLKTKTIRTLEDTVVGSLDKLLTSLDVMPCCLFILTEVWDIQGFCWDSFFTVSAFTMPFFNY